MASRIHLPQWDDGQILFGLFQGSPGADWPKQPFSMMRYRSAHHNTRAIFAIAVSILVTCLAAFGQATNSDVLARIAVLSDPHVNLETNGMDATFAGHFIKAISEVNAANVDFVLIAGDLTQDGKSDEFSDFKAKIKMIRAPVWYIPGNHDVGNKVNSGKPEHVTVARVTAYEQEMGPAWFSTNCSGIRIIGVNSSLLGSGLEPEDEMWTFLQKELAAPAQTPTVLFMHYPLFITNLDEPGGIYWNVEPAPRARLYGLIKQAGVKAVLTGHLHRPLVNHGDGILFVSSPPTSFGVEPGKHLEGWTIITIFKNGEAREKFQPLE